MENTFNIAEEIRKTEKAIEALQYKDPEINPGIYTGFRKKKKKPEPIKRNFKKRQKYFVI